MLPSMNGTHRTIILLEDDAVLRALMAEGLTAAKLPVKEAATRQIAEDMLQAAAGQAILVADRSIDAGGLNGFQLAADALERYAELRVIYISGTHIAVRRRTLGPRERALLKPFAMSHLLTAVRELSAG